jgi:transcriptional regulator with XRE-family HTH domain
MYISERLKQFRESQNLSQGDIEERTGLLRCYVSRVENGHTTPSIETLEKFARALNAPLYQLFYDGEEVPKEDDQDANRIEDWASLGPGQRAFRKLRHLLSRMNESDRKLLMYTAEKMTGGKRRKRST